jgi:hypothetical protein
MAAFLSPTPRSGTAFGGIPQFATDAANLTTPTPRKNLPTINETNTGRKKGNTNDFAIQEAALNDVCDFMGSDLWDYSIGSGKRYNKTVELLHVVRQACGFSFLNYRTLMRWIDHYQKHGEAPALTRRQNQRATIVKLRITQAKYFVKEHEAALKEIVDNQPQLFWMK